MKLPKNQNPARVSKTTNATPSIVAPNPVLTQFDQLIADVLAGTLQRSKFRSWEMDILLDIFACGFSKPRILKRYKEAVHRQIGLGAAVPMRPSEFLALKGRRWINERAASKGSLAASVPTRDGTG